MRVLRFCEERMVKTDGTSIGIRADALPSRQTGITYRSEQRKTMGPEAFFSQWYSQDGHHKARAPQRSLLHTKRKLQFYDSPALLAERPGTLGNVYDQRTDQII